MGSISATVFITIRENYSVKVGAVKHEGVVQTWVWSHVGVVLMLWRGVALTSRTPMKRTSVLKWSLQSIPGRIIVSSENTCLRPSA